MELTQKTVDEVSARVSREYYEDVRKRKETEKATGVLLFPATLVKTPRRCFTREKFLELTQKGHDEAVARMSRDYYEYVCKRREAEKAAGISPEEARNARIARVRLSREHYEAEKAAGIINFPNTTAKAAG